MGETKIQWTDETWNPVTGCRKVSPGCKHCYAEGVADRFWATQYPPVEDRVGTYTSSHGTLYTDITRPRRFTDVQVHPDRLDQPLHWRKPRRVFVNSMSDLFHEDVPDDFIAQVFGVIASQERHTFQVLTKRPERAKKLLGGAWIQNEALFGLPFEKRWPLPNVWLGVSVEDQERADERIPLLLETPAAVRFLSCEPLLGPVDLDAISTWAHAMPSEPVSIDWIIVGGESGAKARPMDLAWARSLVEQGRAAGVPVFVKQLGRRPIVSHHAFDEHGPVTIDLHLRDSHGGDPAEWPEDLRVREFPGA
jgi:protein gp37